MKYNKYEQMHKTVLNLCRESQIKILTGRISCLEHKLDRLFCAQKHFFVSEEDFDRLVDCFEQNLDKTTYQMKVLRTKNGYKTVTVQRNDIFAASYAQLMKYPKGSFHPSFVFRAFVAESQQCHVLLNKEVKSFPKNLLTELIPFDYMGSILYLPKMEDDYFLSLYGARMEDDLKVNEYQIFDEFIDADAFFLEAEQRGLLTEKTRKRYSAYSDWVKTEKNPAMKAYRSYQQELLGMTLPPASDEH